MNAVERLEELLNAKDREIEELRDQLREIEDQREWRWTMHTDAKEDAHDLPVPRLQIECEPIYEGSWSAQTWTYSMVYRHFLGHLVFVPLGATKRTGGSMDAPPSLDDLPFRDGAHIRHDAEALGLPAFSIVDGRTAPIVARPNAG